MNAGLGARERRRVPFAALLAFGSGVGAAGVAGVAASCSRTVDAGGLEVLVATNLQTPQDFDTLAIEVDQQVGSGNTWKTYLKDSVLIPGEAQLPAAISIQAGSSSDQLARIRLTAQKNGRPIDLRVATVQIPTDEVGQMTLIIAESCVGQLTVADGTVTPACPTGQSCQPSTGTCGPDLVRGPLPVFTPGALQQIDASVGHFVHHAEAGVDAGVDAGHLHPREGGTKRDTGAPRDAAATEDAAHDAGQDAGACTTTEVVVQGEPKPTEIAVGPGAVYWLAANGGAVGEIASATLDGGVVATFVSGRTALSHLAMDDTHVYWTESSTPGRVLKKPLDGGATVTLASNRAAPTAIAVGPSGVYWTEPSVGLLTVPLVGGSPVTLIQPHETRGVALGPTRIYWVSSNEVGYLPLLDGGTEMVSSLTTAAPAALVAGTAGAFWSVPDAGEIWTFTGDGGISLFAGGQEGLRGLTVGTYDLLWTDDVHHNVVAQAVASGPGGRLTICVGDGGPAGVALAPGGVPYWTIPSQNMVRKETLMPLDNP